MYYTRLEVLCPKEYNDMIIAELAEAGFDTFMETEKGVEAFVEGNKFDADALQSIKERYTELTALTFAFDRIEKKNWNEEWEKSYHPIDVEGQCLIRAEFHTSDKKYPYEII